MYIHVFVDHVSFDRLSLCTFDSRFQTVFEHLKFAISFAKQTSGLLHKFQGFPLTGHFSNSNDSLGTLRLLQLLVIVAG